MRCLLKIQIDTVAGNDAIASGKLPEVLQAVMAKTEPEAAYFATEDGKRTAFIFFDLKDNSDVPGIAEPAFMALNAGVSFMPVMNLEDLQKGLARLG